MSRAVGWTLAIILLVAAAGFGGRIAATRYMASRAVTPKSLGSATPLSDSIPFSRLTISSGDRTLVGWWVRARAESGSVAPAVMFLHGNRSSISDYVHLQRFFYRNGVSSLVFDYTGFGASGGSPSLTRAVEDAATVARVFAESASTSRRTAMGSALGATVLLQAIDSVQPHVHGVVIEGVTASVRESAVRDARVPRFVAPLVPDIADNVQAAGRARVPLLAVHSYADNRFPFSDAERVVAQVPGTVSLVRHPRKGHSAILSSSRTCDWAQVLAFVKQGVLPAEKLDTADVCAAEAQAKAKSDSIAAATRDSLARAAAAKDSAVKAAAARAAAARAASPTKTKSPPTTKKAPTTKGAAPSTKTRTPVTSTKRQTSTKRP